MRVLIILVLLGIIGAILDGKLHLQMRAWGDGWECTTPGECLRLVLAHMPEPTAQIECAGEPIVPVGTGL